MRKLLSAVMLCALLDTALAEQAVREFSWPELKAAGRSKAGEVAPRGMGGDAGSLVLSNASARPATVELLVIDQPGITASVYALRGRIRYEGVEGTGYLEMWNHFADGSAYFSRTLAGQGPMAALSGTSGWRDLALPFSAAGTSKRPARLVVNLVLPGKGKVWIGPLKLVQYEEREDPLAVSGAWWTDRQGGLFGGIAGSLVGLAGALVGMLCMRGRGRAAAMAVMTALTVLGALALIFGIVAAGLGQPYGVHYPLLLGGGLGLMLFGGLRPIIRRRYAEIEMRRMSAADAV
jgi:hypothetical protein